MNLPNANYGRPKNDKKLIYHINDEENTMMYSPQDYTGNRWFGTHSKTILLPYMLNYEGLAKYYNIWQGKFKAELEIESLPVCLDQCMGDSDRSAAMNSDEKNCMRECYFKRVSARDDLQMLSLIHI